jgi:dTDP-glucose 4,6-dehydratase
MKALVTGGCGFIGSALVRRLIAAGHSVLNIDKLTYAGDQRTVAAIAGHPNYRFSQSDITDQTAIVEAFGSFQPDAVFHLAAESHVDRSIDAPGAFIETNLHGTYVMLHAALSFWAGLAADGRARFRFIHVSTDEVFGHLGRDGAFDEESPYRPNSPYAASKAGADHLARAWHVTYGLPTIISNCSNNYGPFQNREKLIPTIIRKALLDQPIPIYGKGENIRDWLYVDDHVAALEAVAARGAVGGTYAIGGRSEMNNLDLARQLCVLLDRQRPRLDGRSYAAQIGFVADRPGHDFRYAINPGKAERELGWRPRETLASGLAKTVAWYLDRLDWTLGTTDVEDRLGLKAATKLR